MIRCGLFTAPRRSSGYTVFPAASPEVAQEIFDQRGAEIALLLTDVVMPGRSGRELYEQLAAVRPGLKVLYMSGYADNTIVRNGLLESGTAFIGKPFPTGALARKVREVLDEAGPSSHTRRHN